MPPERTPRTIYEDYARGETVTAPVPNPMAAFPQPSISGGQTAEAGENLGASLPLSDPMMPFSEGFSPSPGQSPLPSCTRGDEPYRGE